NPEYESVDKGVEIFNQNRCDMIAAVGGGSAIDVAKCIKLYSGRKEAVKFMAIPTTAGTGSEATRYAVIYRNGEKMSVSDEGCIPDLVILDGKNLSTLPEYHRKSSMLDALCHGLESFWSVHSTEESRAYSAQAITQILKYADSYLSNEEKGNKQMLLAANTAGKAINITQTTAGHAMCYKLTGLFGISHGHAAAICVSALWKYMLENTDKCVDPRGKEYLESVFNSIAKAMGVGTANAAVKKYDMFLHSLNLKHDFTLGEKYQDVLCRSVNGERLRNNPVSLGDEKIKFLYKKILKLI
ncbi:MAG: phosphonoacetaldehyde reductase, partial [Butyrivibrio sp.]